MSEVDVVPEEITHRVIQVIQQQGWAYRGISANLDYHQSEDCLQEAWCKFFTKILDWKLVLTDSSFQHEKDTLRNHLERFLRRNSDPSEDDWNSLCDPIVGWMFRCLDYEIRRSRRLALQDAQLRRCDPETMESQMGPHQNSSDSEEELLFAEWRERFSERQQKIAELRRKGKEIKEIAQQLDVSVRLIYLELKAMKLVLEEVIEHH